MSEVISCSQLYIQLEEAMKALSNHSVKQGVERDKSKISCELLTTLQTDIVGISLTRSRRS